MSDTPPRTTECIGCRRCNSSPLNRASVRGTGHEKRPNSALSSSCLYCSRAILESEDSSVSSETLIDGSTRWHWNAGKRRRLNPSSNPGTTTMSAPTLVVALSIEPQRTAEDHDLYSASSSLPSSLPRASPGPNVEHPLLRTCNPHDVLGTSPRHITEQYISSSRSFNTETSQRLPLPAAGHLHNCQNVGTCTCDPQLNAVHVPRTR